MCWFGGSWWSAWWAPGAVVALGGVECECADDFAGVCVDDADVEICDEQDDAGSVEWSSESDVVHVAVDAQADASGADAVVADAVLGGVASGRGGFGSGLVGGGWGGAVWE